MTTKDQSMKLSRNPAAVHPPVASYVHQIEISGPERMLVLSGQLGRGLDGSVPEDAIEQIDLALQNLLLNLEAAHMQLSDLVKVTFYLVGEMDPARRRAVIAARLGEHLPCMTLLYVAALATPQYKVEIDAWASSAS
jgi:2-iminobutanoate/2-iminopropanoate deaminase